MGRESRRVHRQRDRGVRSDGDLLILYGMNITLTPDPYLIHLINCIGDAELLNIQAKVTFDSQGVDEDILKCGWILGKSLPSNGPLKDVSLGGISIVT